MLYFEEEETKNEQKINVNSLVCVIWEMFFKKFVWILYFSSIRRDVGMGEFRKVCNFLD